jgi:hypothetical protein
VLAPMLSVSMPKSRFSENTEFEIRANEVTWRPEEFPDARHDSSVVSASILKPVWFAAAMLSVMLSLRSQ